MSRYSGHTETLIGLSRDCYIPLSTLSHSATLGWRNTVDTSCISTIVRFMTYCYEVVLLSVIFASAVS